MVTLDRFDTRNDSRRPLLRKTFTSEEVLPSSTPIASLIVGKGF